MKTKFSVLSRVALTAAAAICICSSALAGPDRSAMFIMIHGKMMQLVPMTKDMALKNGTKVMMSGEIMTPAGKKMMVKEGDMVSSEGKIMSPGALHLHGG